MIVTASCDWLTLSKVNKNVNLEADYVGGKTALRLLFDEIALATIEWSNLGYKGDQCTETKVRYGARNRKDHSTDELFVASGKSADLAISSMDSGVEVKCTRIDIQATCYFDNPRPMIASDLYHNIQMSKRLGDSLVGRRSTSVVRSDTGETLYVGKRKGGGKLYRLYDKSYDYQSPLGTIWRQEVQYGRRYASNALDWYMDHRDSQTDIIKMVNREFTDAMQFSLAEGKGLSEEYIPEADDNKGTIESKLRWLRDCVRPVVIFLSENHHVEPMLDALGLEELGWDCYKSLID